MRYAVMLATALVGGVFLPRPAEAQECAPGNECEVCQNLENNYHRMTCGTPILA